jgi:hypothetical protein
MKQLIVFAILASVIIGCSSSNFASYRPPGSTESPWRVTAEKNALNQISVSINDSLVVKGGINIFGSSEELKGTYRGHNVVAMLTKVQKFLSSGIQCVVLIDGEMVSKFEW